MSMQEASHNSTGFEICVEQTARETPSEVSPSILETLLTSASPPAPTAGAGITLVGEVLSCSGSHARLRWRSPEGLMHETDADAFEGRVPQPGCQVLFVQPANRYHAVILGVLPGARPTDEAHEGSPPADVASRATQGAAVAVSASDPTSPSGVEATVDGRRVELTAQDEIVLKCGEASITLRRNGRIIIRGAYVESHAKGTNRIKGGSVLIN